MLQVALVFLWLVCGLFMADLGLIYMMVLKNHLQYEKQKRGKSREAGKQPSTAAQKLEKEESKKSREQRSREAGRAGKHGSSKAEKQRCSTVEKQSIRKVEKQRSKELQKQKSREKQKSKMNKEAGKQKSQKEMLKTENMPSPSKICLKPCQLMSPPGTSGALCDTCSNIV